MSTRKSDTTVVITTYNDSVEVLRTALLSVVRQSFPVKEILVVDDGSEVNTSELVLASMDPDLKAPIRLLRKVNGGPSSARNLGIKNCKTKYIAFLDSDDVMVENNIEVKEGLLDSLGSDYFGVFGTYIRNPGGVQNYSDIDGVMEPNKVGHANGFPGGSPSYLFSIESLNSIGGFDEDLVHNEDFDLIIRLIRKGYKVKGNAGPGFIRNYRIGSLTRSHQELRIYQNVGRFLDKAERCMYFSEQELLDRRKQNELSLARRLISKRGARGLAIQHLKKAFQYSQAKGFKEKLAFYFLKFSEVALPRVFSRHDR